MLVIHDEEINKIEEVLQQNPDLKRYIKSNIIKEFFSEKDRLKQHPLFFYLLYEGNPEKLVGNLQIMEKKCDKFKTVLKKIHEREYEVFHSYITELDVLSHYYSKMTDNFVIEYEPYIGEKESRIDAKFTINRKEYYLEIFTLFEDREIKTIRDIQLQLRLKIDALTNNPYAINTGINETFTVDDIDYYVSEVKNIIREVLTEEKKEDSLRYGLINKRNVLKDSKPIGDITLFRFENVRKGHVMGQSSYVNEMHDAGRFKNRILGKIDKQLPSNKRNIVVINLSKIIGDGFYDIDDAFLGQKTVLVDKVTFEGSPGRHANGIVHHEKGIYISMIIAYINDDYSTRRYYINDATAIEQLDQEEWKLF